MGGHPISEYRNYGQYMLTPLTMFRNSNVSPWLCRKVANHRSPEQPTDWMDLGSWALASMGLDSHNSSIHRDIKSDCLYPIVSDTQSMRLHLGGAESSAFAHTSRRAFVHLCATR